ncbi:MAG: alpha-glucan family phosphorylase [Acidobacteriaceae bacterium]|nr:alpha-glucan family phosphorylase [Acidobacteriaceae bacterium]
MNSFSEGAALPERICRLPELAYDLWWTLSHRAREVFRQLDYPLWRLTAHNPVQMLRIVPRERLEQAAQDSAFITLYDDAIQRLDAARTAGNTWWSQHFADLSTYSVAYFSAEFALHQSLPIYAGGLGVLAGDLCKEASDLGLPLVGVGFMYPQGYFHQKVTPDGWQVELYERLNWDDAPVERATTPEGHPCAVTIPLGDRLVVASVWRVRLGRVALYLLDTDVPENDPHDRELSARLYAGDHEMRLRQEIILGIGGVRALRSVNVSPAVWHLNEGHVAFVVLERMRELLEQGESFESALGEIRSTTAFTTHTPVSAGHDMFGDHLVERYLERWWGALEGVRPGILALGRHDNGGGPLFNMTALALRTAGCVNAVSQLHRKVTSNMWAPIWHGVTDKNGPLKAVTNGIHVPTWIAPVMAKLFDRYLGPGWWDRHDEPAFWDGIASIPDHDLWAVRQSLRSYLFAFMRERARHSWVRERESLVRVVMAGMMFDPAALTIGFARRFAGYKRADLIFHNPERLARILNAGKCPVQIVFAGKAHPADDIGKGQLQRVYQRAQDPAFGGRIAFLEDYDLHIAHFLVQGCDVWLNNPNKPLEASGTSGMKASINGVIHLSVGDGWWAEGHTGSNGWLIDSGPAADQGSGEDARDADALYHLLETEVVPMFYERDEQGVPRRWVRMVKEAIRTVAPLFSARRMVKQYALEMYAPLMRRHPAAASDQTGVAGKLTP